MNLSIENAYLLMFYTLDMYYWRTKDYSLSILLGILNPNLFKDSISADPAIWDDFIKCIGNMTLKDISKKSLTLNEAFTAMILILEMYAKNFGFELDDVISNMNLTINGDTNAIITWNEWEENANLY